MVSDEAHGSARQPFAGAPGLGPQGLDPDESVVTFQPGQVIGGQYLVRGVLGRGPTGVSYKVLDQSTQQRMVLKAVFPSKLADPEANRRFIREMNVARRLRHNGIAVVHDIRQIDALSCFTQEYVEGVNLRRVLVERAPFPVRSAGGIIARVCRILEYAHELTVHAHLTPEHIIVRQDLVVKVVDFGLARSLGGPEAARRGATAYLAPELHTLDEEADPRADIYSLGVIFFEMLTGQLPGEGKRLSHLRPDAPQELEMVIARALVQKDQRFASVKDLREATEQVLLVAKHAAKTVTREAAPSAPLPAIPAIPRSTRDTPTQRRRRLPWGGATEWENWEQKLKTTQVRPRKRKRGLALGLNIVIGLCFLVGMAGLILALGPDYLRGKRQERPVRRADTYMNTAATMSGGQGLGEPVAPAPVEAPRPALAQPAPVPPPPRSLAPGTAGAAQEPVQPGSDPDAAVPAEPPDVAAQRPEEARLIRQLSGRWVGSKVDDPASTWNVEISAERIDINGPGHRLSGSYDMWRGERFIEIAYRLDMAAISGALRNYEAPDNLVNMIAELVDGTHLRLALNPPNDPRRPTGFQRSTLGISLDLALQ